METGTLQGTVKTITDGEFMMVYTDEWAYLKHQCSPPNVPVKFYPILPDMECINCSKRVPTSLWCLYNFYISTYIQVNLTP